MEVRYLNRASRNSHPFVANLMYGYDSNTKLSIAIWIVWTPTQDFDSCVRTWNVRFYQSDCAIKCVSQEPANQALTKLPGVKSKTKWTAFRYNEKRDNFCRVVDVDDERGFNLIYRHRLADLLTWPYWALIRQFLRDFPPFWSFFVPLAYLLQIASCLLYTVSSLRLQTCFMLFFWLTSKLDWAAGLTTSFEANLPDHLQLDDYKLGHSIWSHAVRRARWKK